MLESNTGFDYTALWSVSTAKSCCKHRRKIMGKGEGRMNVFSYGHAISLSASLLLPK